MLRFFNKKGKKVMEMKDNGDLVIKEGQLKKDLEVKENVIEPDEDKKNKEEDK